MRFGKIKFFFILNGLVLAVLFLYFAPWLFSKTVTGQVVTPYEPTTIHVAYVVNHTNYLGSFMRNGVEFTRTRVPVRYLIFHPGTARINSFMGLWAEPLAWWGVFLLASAMLLLTHNAVFSKGTVFQVHKKFPWISMEEYFPLQNGWFYYWQTADGQQEQDRKPVHSKKDKKQLPGKQLN